MILKEKWIRPLAGDIWNLMEGTTVWMGCRNPPGKVLLLSLAIAVPSSPRYRPDKGHQDSRDAEHQGTVSLAPLSCRSALTAQKS